jgi:hypothetical protein
MSQATESPTTKLEPMAPGQRYGRLVAFEFRGRLKGRGQLWRFHCDCGCIVDLMVHSIRAGGTKSCGCLKRELLSGRTTARTHGMTYSPEFNVWRTMKKRCENPNHDSYPLYGGQGVIVCARWRKSFANFFADMGPRPSPTHSLDRFPDKDGDYEPGNCRWATIMEQARNRCSNVFVMVSGRRLILKDACKELGLDYARTKKRLSAYGWSFDRAVNVARYGRNKV